MTDVTKQEDGQEQTIEEILTTIRQVISDDTNESSSTKVKHNDEGQTVIEELKVGEDDVLELTEIVEDSDDIQKLSGTLLEEEARNVSNDLPDISASSRGEARQALLSDHAAEVATDKLSGLTGVVASVRDVPLGNTQQSIADLVKELLRPMLKEWLDDNLPPLVERLVEKEIAKLVSRAKDS